jgi:hypothetical protein
MLATQLFSLPLDQVALCKLKREALPMMCISSAGGRLDKQVRVMDFKLLSRGLPPKALSGGGSLVSLS